MIKLLDLLNEIDIPKNTWTVIPSSELKDYDEEIFKLISTAYAPIGGHPNFTSPNSITGKESDAQFIATGHDGTKPAKSKVVNYRADLLKQSGYYIEVSGAWIDILSAKGVKPVDDEELVRKVLKGKDIEWLGDGKYKRDIAGKLYTKTLMGKPL